MENLECRIKKGSIVSWISCGGRYHGKVTQVYHQWAFVKSKDGCEQTFDIVNDNKLTLEKA